MGECGYSMRLEFSTPAKAKKAQKALFTFLDEAARAYDYWQENRDSKDPKEFFKDFEDKFPLSTDYMKECCEDWGKDCNNGPSGFIGLGNPTDYEPFVSGTEVIYVSPDVWHLMDWTPVTRYLQKKLGAIKSVWNTEENVGWADAVQLYDWEEIVKNILEKREVLPLLLGIHPELNEMIARRLKK